MIAKATGVDPGKINYVPYKGGGEAKQALRDAPHSFEGEFAVAGQDHFYLETQAAWAKPGEAGTMFVVSSTQHPSEVQVAVAGVLGVNVNKVIVQVDRHQDSYLAALELATGKEVWRVARDERPVT